MLIKKALLINKVEIEGVVHLQLVKGATDLEKFGADIGWVKGIRQGLVGVLGSLERLNKSEVLKSSVEMS